jgi:hypothetical protein
MALYDVATHFAGDLYRNIASIRVTQDLADDLADEPADAALFIRAELDTKPRRPLPSVNRPFEPGYGQAVLFPFVRKPWFEARFSDGSFPAWYGSLDLETTVHETVHHFRRRHVEEAGFDQLRQPVIGERKVYLLACDALLIDLRGKLHEAPDLVNPESYAFCHQVGVAIQSRRHPGLLTRSARCGGDNAVLFDPVYLSNPRDFCFLTYRFLPGAGIVEVERAPGEIWLRI